MSFFAEYSTAKLVYDETINNYTCTNNEDIINSVGMHQAPNEAQEHYTLWLAVKDAIHNLRSWEKARNLKKFPLDEVLRRDRSPHAFARKWIEETFTKSDFEQRLENEQLRKVYGQNYL